MSQTDSEQGRPKDPKKRIAKASKKEVDADAPAPPSAGPSPIDENQNLDLEKLKAEVDGIKAALARTTQIHRARIWGLVFLFALVVAWLWSILWLVHLSGTEDHLGELRIHLPQPVVLALIGTTTVNVLALFVIAAKWLYPSGKGSGD